MKVSSGLFGKLPRHGDFLRHGMDEAGAQGWDGWLSAGLAARRQTLGEGFPAAHDAAACLRFLLRGAGVWRVGVVCPSLDAAGRRFFLVLQLDGLSEAAALAHGGRLGARLEDLAYEALGERYHADELLLRLRAFEDQIDPLEATAWTDLGVTAGGDGVWWRAACETRPPASRAAGWGEEGILDMMFEQTVGSIAA